MLNELYAMASNSSSHFTDSDYQPTSNSHAGLWNIPKQIADCCDTMSVGRVYTYSNHVAWVLALDFSLKAKAKTFMRCPRGSARPRPGFKDNKTDAMLFFSRLFLLLYFLGRGITPNPQRQPPCSFLTNRTLLLNDILIRI